MGLSLIASKNFLLACRPACCVDDLGSADMIVGAVAITLKDAFEVSQEPLRPFPSPAKPKIKHHRSTRPDPNAALDRVLIRNKAATITYYVYGLGLIGQEQNVGGMRDGSDVGTDFN